MFVLEELRRLRWELLTDAGLLKNEWKMMTHFSAPFLLRIAPTRSARTRGAPDHDDHGRLPVDDPTKDRGSGALPGLGELANFRDNREIVMLAGIKADLLRFEPHDPSGKS
jgi:hypothetical protein